MDNKIIHPGIKDSRVLTYLNQRNTIAYRNTELEDSLLQHWRTKYTIAKAEYEKSRANSATVHKWRDAYEGLFYQIDDEGNTTETRIKAIRKMAFELVEEKVNSHIPAPKMTPRYYADILPVRATEKMLMHEIDRMISEEVNDEAEHLALIDGSVWLKVSWNPFDNTHERSGNPVIMARPIDKVYPQPGVKNIRYLEYLFDESEITVSQAIDLYNREIVSPNENDVVPIVECYYLNEDRYVGKFVWCEETGQVLCNDLEWGIRRRRECSTCGHVSNFEDVCPICGSKEFVYKPVKKEILEEPLSFIKNPYRSGESDDKAQDSSMSDNESEIPAGTELPHYLVRQLPYVLYKRISAPNSIYGISQVELILENQDIVNKFLTKAENKGKSSQTIITKMRDTNIEQTSKEMLYVEVDSPEECQAIQIKQIDADISKEVVMANTLYEAGKSTVGVTNTDQGKADPTARSGKAKQLQMAASAKRDDAPSTLRNLAYSSVYELMFKYMLAFSDEPRSFVNLLPDGTEKQEEWSKYMFLAVDKNGEYYYRDDFAWSVDTATEITQDRAAMWQLITNDFINGTMGTAIDPTRALLMYWNMMDQQNYPTAKFALAFLKESTKHLPTEVEQALASDPQAVDLALSYMRDKMNPSKSSTTGSSGQWGGSRPNSGQKGNGASHAANVEKNNNKNRAVDGKSETTSMATSQGGMQGGTGGIK